MTSTGIDAHYDANLRSRVVERRKRREKTISVRVLAWGDVSGTKAECHEFRSHGFHDGV